MVDIPKELDYMWSIDVKKSSASLPDVIRTRLYSCIDFSVIGSKKVHEYRGRKTPTNDINYVWDRFENRDKKYDYKINRDLPQLKLFESQLEPKQITMFNNILELIEEGIPNNQIYLDTANNTFNSQEGNQDIDIMISQINDMLNIASQVGSSKKELLDIILKTEPYVNYKELKEKFDEMGSEYYD